MRRRTAGTETWSRLLEWTRGPGPAERLTAHILRSEGFEDLDPSHPLGGPDGLKDVVCRRNGHTWRAAAYFPRGQRPFRTVKTKVKKDLGSGEVCDNQGFVFVTNQELSLGNRNELSGLGSQQIEIYHRERITSILDSPRMYGVRLDFLDIEMNREEQLAFIAEVQSTAAQNQAILAAKFDALVLKIENARSESTQIPMLPVAELREFSSLLMQIGAHPWSANPSGLRVPLSELREYANLLMQIGAHPWSPQPGGLQVPLAELREYASLLMQIGAHPWSPQPGGLRVPLAELREYATLLMQIGAHPWSPQPGGLQVPLAQLREYVILLDTALQKVRELSLAQPRGGVPIR